MSTNSPGVPCQPKRRLEALLPKAGVISATVRLPPRNPHGRQCPAYDAQHCKVHGLFTPAPPDPPDVPGEALKAMTGVYAATQVPRTSDSVRAGNTFTNLGWPAPLGAARPRAGLRAARPGRGARLTGRRPGCWPGTGRRGPQ